LILESLVERVEIRHLLAARWAPSGPEVHQYHFSLLPAIPLEHGDDLSSPCWFLRDDYFASEIRRRVENRYPSETVCCGKKTTKHKTASTLRWYRASAT
jgi:hypothetical protein